MDDYSASDYSSTFSKPSIDFKSQPIQWCLSWLYYDPTPWLTADVELDDDDMPYFPPSKQWTTMAGYVRHYLYNPISPEFTSLQQFSWAVVIGVIMGIYTAVWKTIVEAGVDFVWETVPEFLLEHGVFTELDGVFPLYHYMWIIPTVFGAILSYIFVVIPVKIPGQNEWIASLHKSGVQDYRTFWPLWLLSTCGMLSGLSLGPELPLVLTSGMFGSWLGLICRQSMLQARVMNLTAASAAIGVSKTFFLLLLLLLCVFSLGSPPFFTCTDGLFLLCWIGILWFSHGGCLVCTGITAPQWIAIL